MDIDLAPELKDFRDAARRFAEGVLGPHVERAEADEATPRELFVEAGRAGFLGIRYPESVGGQDASVLAETILREEMARVCSGLAAALSVSSHLGTYPIHAFGSPDQQQHYLVPALAGEKVSAFGLTEPGAGSDVRSITTRATRDGNDWVLTGRKTYITNATIADFVIVIAYTDPDAGTEGMAMFVVDLPNDRVEVTPLKKMGHLSSEIGEIALDDVRVPDEACLGGPTGAWKKVMKTLGIGRVVVSGGAIGLAQEAIDLAVEYAADRTAFGAPIGSNQGISFPLARAAAQTEAARLAVYRAARLYDDGGSPIKEVSIAKLLAGEAVVDATDTAIRVFGGSGYVRGSKIERLYRDARYFPIVEGTGEIHLRVIASQMGL